MKHHLKGLSFDLSRKSTGIVYWEGEKPVKTGVLGLPAGYLGLQLDLWSKALLRILMEYEPDWMAWEDARAVSKAHGQITFAMSGILLMTAYRADIPTMGFSQPTVKKALTGSGNAKKPEMLAAARLLYPKLDIPNDDVADAIGVGLCMLSTMKVNNQPV